MKGKEALAEIRDSLPEFTRRNIVKLILVLVAVVLCALAITAVMFHFLPSIERFSDYAYPAIFIVTLLSSATVLFPAPGMVVWWSIVVTFELNPLLAGLVAGIGGALGEITAYYAGRLGRSAVSVEQARWYQVTQGWMERHGGLTIFAFAFLWILPFDVAGIVAGMVRYPVRKFLFFCAAGRIPRSILEAYLYYYTGESILSFIAPYLPSWLAGSMPG